MELVINWHYEDETKVRTYVYHDIDPKTITINNGFLHFGRSAEDSGWLFSLALVDSMKMEEV